MKLLVGLGNPGNQYAGNRHNIGFMAIDAIASAHGISGWKSKHAGLIAEGNIGNERVLLLKPQTFMNKSGDSVQQVTRFFKIPVGEVIVFYDELDLAPGKVRVKIGGGNGGHNGLRSIDPQIGLDYKRVRLGIGHPGKEFVTPHVLGDFAKSDKAWLDPLLDEIARQAPLLLKGDDNGFMNKLALAVQGGEEEKPAAASKASAAKPAQSHIRQARPAKPQAEMPKSGPMADMLNKLFGKGE
ncbi:aminoacyl-tRNA hydrolase [Devosia sp. 63-57]|uniref:aminoacyl-tRNA hydrolase n=1 Tax=Devosia sp. 63-57 TaxID=1895751 RepID=UPI00086DFB2F|nr:aminoacyl-tRNA hydrolase [Devosia sp. 63-57]ODT49624.1 MAG: aminoacyl-tRNA hydrolase [Pelagibacterium sp. SCN 63-126]ODU87638.1 MAG: aminoacyl-tRNA hydrolase [Pelagibacterium sp. SCN 63-17]OJX45639.1 MAG: aminoacyl-tRNA hydrolase [Devosia sp. 63-57]